MKDVHNTNTNINLGIEIRAQFPVFSANSSGHMAYLDTAASSQKPACVIDRLSHYLAHEHANIHRGAYSLSANATQYYDEARKKVANYIGAKDVESVIFTRGTTEAINLVAHSFEKYFEPGDTILLSILEHHSNIIPWQMLAKRKNLKLAWVDINDDGSLNLSDLKSKLAQCRPKLLAITGVSNALGTIVPIAEVVALAKKGNCYVLVDCAQALVHQHINVDVLNVDFIVASGHKMYGPTGIGFLYGKRELLEQMDPFMGGGDMIATVAMAESTWAEVPRRFEAGTPAIGEAIAFGTAIDFLSNIGTQAIEKHESRVFHYGLEKLRSEKGVTTYGPALSGGAQASILSFNVNGIHPHDFSSIADSCNVQVRAGHHCAMPLLKRLNLQSTARASLGIYSCEEDIDTLLEAVRKARKVFKL